MKIEWKKITDEQYNIINNWLSNQDRHNLCMESKDWKQTAQDIGECLRYMENAQFKNIIGYINNKPVVAVMFGIEQIGVLNLYDIVVNPSFRNLGVAKNVIKKLLHNDNSLHLIQPYQKVVSSTLPDNKKMQHLFTDLGFDNLGFDGEYVVFEKAKIQNCELEK